MPAIKSSSKKSTLKKPSKSSTSTAPYSNNHSRNSCRNIAQSSSSKKFKHKNQLLTDQLDGHDGDDVLAELMASQKQNQNQHTLLSRAEVKAKQEEEVRVFL